MNDQVSGITLFKLYPTGIGSADTPVLTELLFGYYVLPAFQPDYPVKLIGSVDVSLLLQNLCLATTYVLPAFHLV